MVAPTGFEPVNESRPRFTVGSYEACLDRFEGITETRCPKNTGSIPQRDTIELAEFKYAISLLADHRLARALGPLDGPGSRSWSRCGCRSLV